MIKVETVITMERSIAPPNEKAQVIPKVAFTAKSVPPKAPNALVRPAEEVGLNDQLNQTAARQLRTSLCTPPGVSAPGAGIASEGIAMEVAEQARFERLYQQHLQAPKLQGKRPKTIDACSRALCRLRGHFGCCPDTLVPMQLREDFAALT